MKSQENFRSAQRLAMVVGFLAGLVAMCSITRPVEGQTPNEWSSLQLSPSRTGSAYPFSGSSQTDPGTNKAEGLTSLGRYNVQNQSLVAPWRADQPPLTVTSPLDQAQGPIFQPPNEDMGTGSGNRIWLPPSSAQPNGGGFSAIISPNGSVIPLMPHPICGSLPCSGQMPKGIFLTPNAATGDPGSSAGLAGKGWRSYVCQGEKGAADSAAITTTLKGIGVESGALDALTDAAKAHSAIVVVAVVGGYLFYRYNCPAAP